MGQATLPYVGFGAAIFDYDNDGRLDLAIANGHVIDNTAQVRQGSTYAQPRLLFRNIGNRKFADVSSQSGPAFAAQSVGRTLVVGDVDNDGDLDILITSSGQRPALLRNDGGSRQHAIDVRLVGVKSNRDGIGARVKALIGAVTAVREARAGSSYLGQNDARIHLGLGAAAIVDRLEVKWPSGTNEVLTRVQADAVITVTEGQGITRRTPFKR